MSDSLDSKKLVGERLKAARELAGLTQTQVAECLQVTEMTVYRWESGKYEPSYGKLQLLSNLYRQPAETFIGIPATSITGPVPPVAEPAPPGGEPAPPVAEPAPPGGEPTPPVAEPAPPGIVTIPVRGYVSAGVPRDLWQVDLGTVPVSDQLIGGYSDLFALVVSGDALKADTIHDGDMVYVDPGAGLEEGKTYIVLMENGEICARRLNFEDGQVRLRSSYEHYDELRVTGAKLLGKIVWHLRRMD
jgi:SOS-response transcriptional repressor LexA